MPRAARLPSLDGMNTHDRGTGAAASVVARPILAHLVLPVLGVGLGLLVRWAAAWVASLPFAPFQGLFELLEALPEPGSTIAAAAVGGAGGLVLAFIDHHYALGLAVSADRVVLRRLGTTEEVDRSEVHGVFLELKGKNAGLLEDGRLVLLGPRTEELVRVPCDLNADAVRRAFTEHGWPWLEADPHRGGFKRWVDGLPELSAKANALLKARAEALEADGEEDAEELRRELLAAGVVVRDEKKRQYWRPIPGDPDTGA
ncbi:hypothetical protein GCM10009605_26100 [Nocardiopsis composta]